MLDQRELWLAEKISYRQFLAEQTLLREEVTWAEAWEATSSVLIAHPEINGDQTKPRKDWKT